MKVQRLADIDAKRFTQRAQSIAADITASVEDIFAAVAARGDAAVRELAQRFDGVDLTAGLLLPRDAWDAAAKRCPVEVQRAIRANLGRIRAFHEMQRGREQVLDVVPGLRLGRRPIPYDAVACYVPGGRASYPSTVLMTVVPAVVAGVTRIFVVTPCRDGLDPAVAYAARVAGATDIVPLGGAHAVAALALGTTTLPRVQAIVGPGNAYVTAAKQLARAHVWTDAPAGPSELLVLADQEADPTGIALDLAAQAEHDPDAQVLLVTTSEQLANQVVAALADVVAQAPRRDIMQASLDAHGAILVAADLDEAVVFCNEYAPEHLEIHTTRPQDLLDAITTAGSVFVGAHTPVSLGDYGSGTNHVLPTMGQARLRGGLCVDDFRRWMTWQEATPAGLEAVASDIIRLAEAEGLHGHADAVRRRL